MVEATLTLAEPDHVLALFGARDQHLRLIRENLGVSITHRNGTIRIAGEEQEDVGRATNVLERLKVMVERRGNLTFETVSQVLAQISDQSDAPADQKVDVMQPGREIRPRTPGQARYIEAIRQHALTFATGPAGSGKTWLAVAAAVESLKQRQVRRLVLVRPAVEAGESLGFLPGDLQSKINPYLRPLLDALREMMDFEQVKRLMEQEVIEVLPLAYMRGRTLNDAFIILDEAQNTTVGQMKMFLTRMGEGSRAIVAGDTTQVDLPRSTRSGLIDALGRLRNIKGVGVVTLTRADIVRHRLVQEIVRAYGDLDEGPKNGKKPRR